MQDRIKFSLFAQIMGHDCQVHCTAAVRLTCAEQYITHHNWYTNSTYLNDFCECYYIKNLKCAYVNHLDTNTLQLLRLIFGRTCFELLWLWLNAIKKQFLWMSERHSQRLIKSETVIKSAFNVLFLNRTRLQLKNVLFKTELLNKYSET